MGYLVLLYFFRIDRATWACWRIVTRFFISTSIPGVMATHAVTPSPSLVCYIRRCLALYVRDVTAIIARRTTAIDVALGVNLRSCAHLLRNGALRPMVTSLYNRARPKGDTFWGLGSSVHQRDVDEGEGWRS